MTPEEALRQIMELHAATDCIHVVSTDPHPPQLCGMCGADDGWYDVPFPCETYEIAARGLGISFFT